MKFTCTRENLTRVLDVVCPLAGKQSNLPILDNILFHTKGSSLEASSTNLESAVKTTARARAEEEGSFTVPAKTLFDYVRLLNGEQVAVSLSGNELSVVCGNSETKIKGTPADEYPVIPDVEDHMSFSFDPATLRDALGKVVIAVARNEIRPELSGVYFGFCTESYPEGLVLAATDSYRLAETKIPLKETSEPIFRIVPARVVYEMIRLLSLAEKNGSSGPVNLMVGENQIALQATDMSLTARLIDGTYPDYAQIIPDTFKTSATVNLDMLANTIKAASLFSTTGVNAVSFDLNASKKTMNVSSMSTQTGEHTSELEADVKGEENSILLNYRYVLDGLSHMGEETVLFGVNSADSPCVFKPQSKVGYVYVVMPIRQ